MVKRKTPTKPATRQADPMSGPPFVSAMLRLAWQRARKRVENAIHAEGFVDLQDSHFAVLSYPPPDGVRLSELAREKRMSRQAANYIVGQLEELGYLERRATGRSERRLVHLTERGRKVVRTVHDSMRDLQAQWAQQVGRQRFETFMDVLRQLHPDEGQAPAGPVQGAATKAAASRRAPAAS